MGSRSQEAELRDRLHESLFPLSVVVVRIFVNLDGVYGHGHDSAGRKVVAAVRTTGGSQQCNVIVGYT